MFIYLNGDIVSLEEAKISPLDHGYLYGVGLFETIRIYDGHPFLLDDHLVRLEQGLNELRIHYKIRRGQAVKIINEVLEVNNLRDAYIRFNVSAGNAGVGLKNGDYLEPTIIVFVKTLPPFAKEKEGIILHVKRNTPEGPFRLKSHHFLNNIYAKREVGENPMTEGIFLTQDGYLAEGITSNLFWVKGGALYTPSLATGILNGITRQYVLSIARNMGLKLHEGLYGVEHIEACDEAFITNSIQEIVPLTKLSSIPLPGMNGAITAQLLKRYQQDRMSIWSRNDILRGL